jgi:signal transduction histidine kinase
MSQSDQNSAAVMALPELKRAYDAYTAEVRVRNSKVACALVMALMPAGFVLDSFVYHEARWHFLAVRFFASALALLVFLGLRRPNLAGWQSRLLCMGWYVIPAVSISWMIGATDGYTSAYYAGLNLVILAVSSVIQATLQESIIAVGLILFMFVAACFLHPILNPTGHVYYRYTSDQSLGMLVNNWYFILLTSIIVVTGNFFFNRLRFREFMLRFELDRNRQMLEDSNQKLLELDQIKGRFFANISHELRTPLTLLLSPLETMMHGRDRQIDADSRSLMAIMHGNGMRLLKLINDLLDLVRLESGRMEVKREALEMSAFVRGMIGAAQQMADAKGLRLETRVEPGLGAVLADRDKLEKMILNLVFNALKFTPAGGSVALSVEKTGEQLIISVKDTGVGISEKNLPFVFDRFWQADNSSKRKYQGVGIGLSLVKELTEVQGGQVAVESEEGRGTTFTIQLPFLQVQTEPKHEESPAAGEPATAAPSQPTPAQSEEWLGDLYRRAALFPSTVPTAEAPEPVEHAANGTLPSLVVADDEPDMLRFLKSQLNTRYRVIEAVDGLQALEKAGQFLPDIILLDMNMPGKDGLQVCRELREKEATREIPVIILTARADEETKLASLSAGANDFLSKPFSTTELHVRIKNLVETHQYQDKLARQNETLESTIEQLKETETLLVQTEKMVSLGRMSAGIIHEINNPLNYATTGLFTLRNKGKLLAPEQRAEYDDILNDVEEGIGRVKSIVTDLKTFTHPDTEQVDYMDATTIITSALRFLSNEWKDKIEIKQTLPAQFAIRGNRNKLLQVFVNLLQNSLDALKQKTFVDEKPTIWIEATEADGKTILTIRDNGEGIDAAALDKIFDPFFTTKDVGEGMGLGLTICYRIVRGYEGHISVRSERGKFCEFKLEFPGKK